MASIFDLLGGMSPEQNQGLLAAAAQVLRNSGPGRPYSFGQGLGDALGGFNAGMQDARQRSIQEKLLGLKLKDAEADFANQQLTREQKARISKRLAGNSEAGTAASSLLGQFGDLPTSPFMQSMAEMGSAAPPAGRYGAQSYYDAAAQTGMSNPGSIETSNRLIDRVNRLGETPQAAALALSQKGAKAQGQSPMQAQGVNHTDAYVQRLLTTAQVYAEEGDVETANKLYEQAAKLRPKYSNELIWANGPDGKPVGLRFADDGSKQQLDGLAPREKLHFLNTGGQTLGVGEYSGAQSAAFNNTVDPGEQLSAATQRRGQDITMRGQNMVDARTREQNAISNQSNALKMQDKIDTRDMTKASQIASFDTMLGTLDRLKSHGGLTRSVGLYSKVPTMPGSDSANFQAELETFKSQAFIPMVAQLKGMGALSDSEGRKLTAAVGALDPSMSEQAFKASIDRVVADMQSARQRVAGMRSAASAEAPAAEARTATLADIAETARKSGRSTAEVTAALRARGYTIGGQ